MEAEETGRKGCIHTSTSSDVENLDWQEINQILVETAKEVFGKHLEKGHTQRKKLGGGKKKLGKQWP